MGNKFKPAKSPPESAKPARPKWLWPAVIGVVAVAAIAIVIWLVQGRQSTFTYSPTVTGQPSASVDQTKFDYGDVKLGTTVNTVFNVKNVGDKDLVFLGEPKVEVLEGC
jgi:hypothetical protein